MPVCFLCQQFLHSINAIYYHYSITHHLEKGNHFRCVEGDCFNKEFGTWQLLRKHFVNFHQFPANAPLGVFDFQAPTLNAINDVENGAVEPDAVCNIPNTICHTENEPRHFAVDFKRVLSDQAAVFIAKLYGNPNLPRSHVQEIVDSTKDFLGDTLSCISEKLSNLLKDDAPALAEINSSLDCMQNMFSTFSSDYRRLKYFNETGFLINPISYNVGSRTEERRVQKRVVVDVVPVKAQFIPLGKMLKEFLQLPRVLSTILQYVNSLDDESEVIQNYIQGSSWKLKKQSYEGKLVFPLFLHFDDLEINNALGSHSSVQKLGVLYFIIPCMPPEYASSLENIFLAVLFHSLDRVQRGSNKLIFSIMVKELNELARKGITVESEEGEKQVYFVLGGILGDNLGLNSILGYTEGFNANYYCRICKNHKSSCQKDCTERQHLLRNQENYLRDARNGVKESGVAEISIWNDVDYFHVTENWIVDSMHDVWEGICKYDMVLILNNLVFVMKLFTIDTLNDRLRAFDFYSNDLSNVPPTLSAEHLKRNHISMSASEMRTFVLCLSLLVGDLVPFDHDIWQFYLTLRQMLDIISARSIQRAAAKLLVNYVEEHNAMYLKLSKDTLKPKHHHLVHYGRVLLESGPLPLISSFRFESKHREFKKSATATSSRRNITHTLALKHQLNVCYRLLSRRGLVPKLENGPVEFVDDITKCDNYLAFKESLPDCFQSRLCTSWVDYKGTKYKVDSCVVLNTDDFVNELSNICFVCEVLLSISFDSDVHAYPVQESREFLCTKVDDLLDPFPVILARMPNGHLYATPKHAL